MFTRILFLAMAACLLASNSIAQTAFWEGTAGISGSPAHSVSTNKKGDIFIMSTSIVRSTDSGVSWKEIMEPNATDSYTGFAIAPNGDLYEGGNGNSPNTAQYAGIRKSTDNGDTWNVVLPGYTIYSITTSPQGDIEAIGDFIFESTDSGATWHNIDLNIDDQQGWWESVIRTRDGSLLVGSHWGLYRSTNNAASWQKVDGPATIVHFALAQTQDSLLYDLRSYPGTSNDTGQLFSSSDDGVTWKSVSPKIPGRMNYIAVAPDGNAVTCDPYSMKLFRTKSGTVEDHSNDINSPKDLIDEYMQSLGSDSAGILYAGTSFGVSRSTDSGATWSDFSVPNGFVSSLMSHPSGLLLASSSWGGGLWHSKNNGVTWTRYAPSSGTPGASTAFGVDSVGGIYAASNGSIYVSKDTGATWSVRSQKFSSQWAQITAIMTAASGALYVSSNEQGIFRSTDTGVSWATVNNGLTSLKIYSMAALDSQILFAAGYEDDTTKIVWGIYRTNDGGANWTPLTTNFSPAIITALIIAPDGSVLAGIPGEGVVRSTDTGATWNSVDSGLTTTNIRTLLSSPSGKLFAATDSGVFLLETGQNQWVREVDGLTNVSVTSFARTADGYVYAGTEGSGIFRSLAHYYNIAWHAPLGVGNNPIAENGISVTSYPNPAQDGCTIRFHLDKPGIARLQLVDPLGRVRRTLFDGMETVGDHDVSIEMKDLPVGTYAVRLTAGGKSSIGVIDLIK